jgi:D-alanyl-lipoteichoic acid acyltransferase DltB (MBOAT superfamily)
MLFNSWEFFFFFLVVYGFYLFLSHRWQNILLLIASYVFYGLWDWRFLFLILFSTAFNFFCGAKIDQSETSRKRKFFLILSLFGNLSILGFFKYFNFFTESLQALTSLFGLSLPWRPLEIILPLGISFYTFETLSYAFDIYKKEMEPSKSFFNFALFVSFFPKLIAGPIERAKNFLPQISRPRKFRLDWLYEGAYLIFWGLFQKVFVADNLAKIVNPFFNATRLYSGAETLLASFGFAVQIYCDFAGYSNIARGLGRLIGFKIAVNFNLPYFATNPQDFWRRWHITLSTWVRDYLYIPLGGNRLGSLRTFTNLLVTMLAVGLWHGAAWTFVVWGAYHGLLLVIHRLLLPGLRKLPSLKNASFNSFWLFVKTGSFFCLLSFGWIIFRANSLVQAGSMIRSIFFNFLGSDWFSFLDALDLLKNLLKFSLVFFLVEIIRFKKNDLFAVLKLRPAYQITLYLIMLYSLLLLGATTHEEFIYFQF